MRILALDVGERYVGVAISDPTATIARPLLTLERGSRKEDAAAVAHLVQEHQVEKVVVGRPLSLDGTVGPQARRVDRYTEVVADQLEVPVVSWDERYSTARADEILRETRSEKAKRRARSNGEIDAIAAAVILQSYLDSRYRDGGGLGSPDLDDCHAGGARPESGHKPTGTYKGEL
jgi:putative Holliday junction resolvase